MAVLLNWCDKEVFCYCKLCFFDVYVSHFLGSKLYVSNANKQKFGRVSLLKKIGGNFPWIRYRNLEEIGCKVIYGRGKKK